MCLIGQDGSLLQLVSQVCTRPEDQDVRTDSPAFQAPSEPKVWAVRNGAGRGVGSDQTDGLAATNPMACVPPAIHHVRSRLLLNPLETGSNILGNPLEKLCKGNNSFVGRELSISARSQPYARHSSGVELWR